MDRASKLIRGLTLPGETISAEEVACAAWPHAVGKKIAAHTQAMRMVRTRLLVAVEDQIWQRQLFGLSAHILRNLERNIGPGIVDDLEFRVIPRRREPQRAIEPLPGPSDEADQIADPVLRGIYRASRQRAGA